MAYRRSQSPIAMRPSSLGPVKRKFDLEEDKGDQYLSPPAKRLNSYTMDRGGLLMAHSNRWAYKFPIDRHVKSIYHSILH